MRQIALINKFPLFLLLAGICTFALSCSSDDGDVINDNNEDIAVDFFLSNEQGEKATSFKSDENIYFDFSLVSNGKKDVKEVFVFPQYLVLSVMETFICRHAGKFAKPKRVIKTGSLLW